MSFYANSTTLSAPTSGLDRHDRTQLAHSGLFDTLAQEVEVSPTMWEFATTLVTPLSVMMPLSPLAFSSARASRRHGRIFGHSPSSSVSSLESVSSVDSDLAFSPFPVNSSSSSVSSYETGRESPFPKSISSSSPPRPLPRIPVPGKQPLARPLVLHLRSLPKPTNVKVYQPTHSTCTLATHHTRSNVKPKGARGAVSLPPISPLTPTFTSSLPPTTNERRRKRMDKLNRTLGEKVPAELVITPMASLFSFNKATSTHKYSHSYSPVSPVFSEQKVRRRSTTINSFHPVQLERIPSSTSSFLDLGDMSKSKSSFHTVKSSQKNNLLRSVLQLNTTSKPVTSTDAKPPTSRRKERDWSGEWNLKDMGEVVTGLRGLKIKA